MAEWKIYYEIGLMRKIKRGRKKEGKGKEGRGKKDKGKKKKKREGKEEKKKSKSDQEYSSNLQLLVTGTEKKSNTKPQDK